MQAVKFYVPLRSIEEVDVLRKGYIKVSRSVKNKSGISVIIELTKTVYV